MKNCYHIFLEITYIHINAHTHMHTQSTQLRSPLHQRVITIQTCRCYTLPACYAYAAEISGSVLTCDLFGRIFSLAADPVVQAAGPAQAAFQAGEIIDRAAGEGCDQGILKGYEV